MVSLLSQVFSGNIIFALILILIVVICMLYYNEFSLPKGMPPGPFRIPIVGHLPFLGNSHYITLAKLGEKYGSVFRLFLGNRPVIVLNDFKAVKEAFIQNADIFSGRPNEEWVTSFPGKQNFIGSDGIFWRDHRRFALTLMRDCGVGKLGIETRIMEEINHFITHLRPLSGKPADIRPLLGMSVSNNICTITLGKRFEYTDPKFLQIRRLLGIIPATTNSLNAFNFLHWLEKIPGSRLLFRQHNVKSMTKSIDEFVVATVDEQKLNHVEGQRDNYPNAFLTERQARLKKTPNDTIFNDVALITNIRAITAAGTETTTITLLWGLIYMMLNPDVQKKVQDELDSVIGSDRNASWSDHLLTPYTEATLYEILRISGIVPINLPHRNKEECVILGYTIPKSSFIVSNLYNVLNDPKTWKDPNTFRPERFLTANGAIEKPEYFIPFSAGKRQCMGEILARMELYLYFTTMLLNFTFKTPEGTKTSLDYKVGTLRSPKYFLTYAISRTK